MTPTKQLHLFIPPQRYVLEGISSGIISIASYVRQKASDVIVRIHDLSHATDYELDSYFKDNFPLSERFFAGITTTTATYQSSLRLARKIKEISRDTIVVFGGHHIMGQNTIILEHHPEVDIVVKGEGEKTMLNLLQQHPNLHNVPGITFRDNGTIKSTPIPTFLSQEELDNINVSIDELSILSPLGKFDYVTYVSARGCTLKCSFCAVSNEKVRSKSIKAVIRHLKYLVLMKGFKRIAIDDNFFAQSYKRTSELCNAIIEAKKNEPTFDFTWNCQTRVESLAKTELASMMRSAGCEAVYLGIENFDPYLLTYLGKTRNPSKYIEQTEKVVKSLLEQGIKCYINLQIGLPEEDELKKKNNILGLKRLSAIAKQKKGELVIFPMLGVVYPGTALFYDLVKRGISPLIFEQYTLWEESHKEMQQFLSCHFAHGTGGLPIGMLNNNKLKDNKFSIIEDRIFWIINYLDDLNKIPNAEVFDYSKYVVLPKTA
jgi:anaerobic magnesium-protoporphyrin IX monomethyl ester cyclase